LPSHVCLPNVGPASPAMATSRRWVLPRCLAHTGRTRSKQTRHHPNHMASQAGPTYCSHSPCPDYCPHRHWLLTAVLRLPPCTKPLPATPFVPRAAHLLNGCLDLLSKPLSTRLIVASPPHWLLSLARMSTSTSSPQRSSWGCWGLRSPIGVSLHQCRTATKLPIRCAGPPGGPSNIRHQPPSLAHRLTTGEPPTLVAIATLCELVLETVSGRCAVGPGTLF
jgi:hypothetical protein